VLVENADELTGTVRQLLRDRPRTRHLAQPFSWEAMAAHVTGS
jgi:hypothetical protein